MSEVQAQSLSDKLDAIAEAMERNNQMLEALVTMLSR